MASYFEFVIHGQPGWTLGFIEGYIRGSGETEGIMNAEAEGFHCETLRERLRELLLPHSNTLHLIVAGDLDSRVRQAVADAVEMGHKTKIIHSQEILGARFFFSATVYSREHGEKIQAMFRDPPEGVTIDGKMSVKLNPKAKGMEMYAPVHHYELRIERCEVRGAVDDVIRLHRMARKEGLIQLEDLALIRNKAGK
jgi:hypothetical protein